MTHSGAIDHMLFQITDAALSRLGADILDDELKPLAQGESHSILFSFRDVAQGKYGLRAAMAEEALSSGDRAPYIDLIKDKHRMTERCDDFFRHLKTVCEERNVQLYEFFTENILDKAHSYGHGAGIVRLQDEDGPAHFLIDPTFRQFNYFIASRDTAREGEDFVLPGDYLRTAAPQMFDQLMTKGYVRLNADNAAAYIHGFDKKRQAGATRFENGLGPMLSTSPIVVDPTKGGRSCDALTDALQHPENC